MYFVTMGRIHFGSCQLVGPFSPILGADIEKRDMLKETRRVLLSGGLLFFDFEKKNDLKKKFNLGGLPVFEFFFHPSYIRRFTYISKVMLYF